MNKYILSLLIIILTTINLPPAKAQQWSEPINISNSGYHDGFPDICVDNKGVLHCIWVKTISSSTRKIYYSKSTDQGESWSTPVKISLGDSGFASDPKIVCDSNNILYVVYKYDINEPYNENLWFTKYENQDWTEPVTIADDWNSNKGKLYLFDRTASGWNTFNNEVLISFGRNGLAWGEGLHTNPDHVYLKQEGDNRSPAGIFEFGSLYGFDEFAPKDVRYPYHQPQRRDRHQGRDADRMEHGPSRKGRV